MDDRLRYTTTVVVPPAPRASTFVVCSKSPLCSPAQSFQVCVNDSTSSWESSCRRDRMCITAC
ncbi:hypothetical protein BGZ63DRAFT_386930 [Mariannaea sp. PMI_226]|nr:hypothetical protein BGZ63DRAFT_386930 [Mariannaea sp. PMI_226]